MSRVAKNPIPLASNLDVTIVGEQITIKGPLGSLTQPQHALVKVVKDGNELKVESADESQQANAMSGTMRALLANMVKGVSQGFEKRLTLVGVGYRAQAKGDVLNLSLGYSHGIEHKMPEGVKVETPSQTEVVIKGIDRQRVGQVAAEVRAYREPEPYKGKGVRYADEVVKLKETKKK